MLFTLTCPDVSIILPASRICLHSRDAKGNSCTRDIWQKKDSLLFLKGYILFLFKKNEYFVREGVIFLVGQELLVEYVVV